MTIRIHLPAVALVCAGFAFVASTAQAQTLAHPRLTVEPVASGLDWPTAMALLGDDDLLVCEKNTGQVKRVTSGTVTGVVLDLPVANEATRGLLGMALHPAFVENGWVYLFYSRGTSDGGAWVENRVSRFTWDGAALDPASEFILTRFTADLDQNLAPECEGGVLRFGPDGMLYGCIGDLGRGGFENPRIEQNSSELAVANSGAIFRLRDDGGIPADNPFADHADAGLRRFFAYGVRNTYGMDFDPQSGLLWTTENGPEVYDEINLVRSGMNSGWLKIMGPNERNAVFAKNLYTPYDAADLVMLPGAHYADPKLSFLHPLGLTALTFIDSPAMPCDLQGRLLFGDFNTGRLYLAELNEARDDLRLGEGLDDRVADFELEVEPLAFGTGWGVTTDLKFGPDGALYHVSLTHGQIRRIRMTGPQADLTGDGHVGLADLQVLLIHFGLDDGGDLNCDGVTNLADLSILLSELEL